MDQNITNLTVDSQSDDSDTDSLSIEQIEFNKILINGQLSYQQKDLNSAIEIYNKGILLAEKLKDHEKIAHFKTNLSVLYFENNDYKTALNLLDEAYILLGLSQKKKSELKLELQLKILSHLFVLYTILNNFEKAQETNRKLKDLLSKLKENEKKIALEFVIFSLFRFSSFKAMLELKIDQIEEIYQGIPLACFYSSMGLNREMNDDPMTAMTYYIKALESWKNCNEIGFVLITLKHIITIAPIAGLNVIDTSNFNKLYQKVLLADEFKGINIDLLFKDYEKKIEIAKNLTRDLKGIEEKFSQNIDLDKSAMNISTISAMNLKIKDIENQEPFWKQALKLRLYKSIKIAKGIANNKNSTKENSLLIGEGTNQISQILDILKEENNIVVLNKLQNMTYTKDAVNMLRAGLNKLRKHLNNQIYGEIWKLILSYSNKKNLKISYLQKKKQISSLISKAYREAYYGDYIIKCNKNTNGRLRKFFRLENNGILRIATKEIYINNKSKSKIFDLNGVQGVVYGKVTNTFTKNYNKSLENHLCFSLISKRRTLDFFCNPEQLNFWFISISLEVKKINKNNYCLEPGKFLWRKFKYILIDKISNLIKSNKKIDMSFIKLILVMKKIKNL